DGPDALLGSRLRAGVGAEHDRETRPVDVRIEQPDALPGGGEGERQVGRDRRLADASFVARHGYHVLHARQRRALRERVLAATLGGTREVDLDVADPRFATE